MVDALSMRGAGLARWSVETDDIEATARRVGYPVEQRRRLLVDGTQVRWRSVGVDEAWDEPWRCAFMAWDDPDLHPARADGVVHANGATGFARLDLDVPDVASLSTWLGGDVPDGVNVRGGGDTGPVALFLASPSGEILVA